MTKLLRLWHPDPRVLQTAMAPWPFVAKKHVVPGNQGHYRHIIIIGW